MSSLSADLRKRVVASIHDGMGKVEAERTFKISRSSVYRWLALYKNDKELRPKSGYQKGHSGKIKDLDEFKKFAEKNKQYTIKKMCIAWEIIKGVSISIPVMRKHLRKIGYTSKKKHFLMSKQMKKSVLCL